jgi:hypothetical protein
VTEAAAPETLTVTNSPAVTLAINSNLCDAPSPNFARQYQGRLHQESAFGGYVQYVT